MCATTAKNAPSCAEPVLAILGSPRADGMSARMLQAFLDELPPDCAKTVFSCYEQRPVPCDDCRFCAHTEGCSKRDLDAFYAALEEAALLVIATPVYHLSFPAPLKALIDRLQRYWSARFILGKRPPIARAKRLVLLTVSGSGKEEGGLMLEKQLAPPLTVIHAAQTACLHVTGADAPDFALEPYLERTRQIARALYQDKTDASV